MKGTVKEKGELLDTLFILFKDLSKKKIKNYLKDGGVLVNGKVVTKYNTIVKKNDVIELSKTNKTHKKSNLDIIYEDEYFFVINKPSGLLSISTTKEKEKTAYHLVREFIKNRKKSDKVFILHRLDKDTSGLMVVALSQLAQIRLTRAISKHHVVREYEAIAEGEITAGGTIDAPIARDPHNRTKMAVMPEGIGREAITHYRVMERFRAHTRIRLRLETGRTHQIRVHMASIHHPLLGDTQYGGRRIKHIQGASEELANALKAYRHQALHAVHLEFEHPITKELVSFDSPLPQEMVNILDLLRKDTKEHGLL